MFELAADVEEDTSILTAKPNERSFAHTSDNNSLALGDISNIDIDMSDIPMTSPAASLSLNSKFPVTPSVPNAPPPSAPRRFRNFYRGDSVPAVDRSCIDFMGIERSPPISLVNMSQDIKSVSPNKAGRLRQKRFREVLRPNLCFGPKFTSPTLPVRARR